MHTQVITLEGEYGSGRTTLATMGAGMLLGRAAPDLMEHYEAESELLVVSKTDAEADKVARETVTSACMVTARDYVVETRMSRNLLKGRLNNTYIAILDGLTPIEVRHALIHLRGRVAYIYVA